MSNRLTNIIASCLLLFVFLITIFSIKNDSLTMDELAHLPAGYSYLTQKDMRLNPEHPPLLKDLSALPLLFIKDIKFPSDIKSWEEDVNGQWDFGRYFLYQTQNPTDKIIFWGRIPMILILILLGFYIFKWTKELFGNWPALLALTLFSFCPTFLAHGRLITTDLGAAFGVVFATYYFLKALKKPDKKNILIAGIAFGIAELLKFSLILLVPFFIFLGLIWWLMREGKFLNILKTLILTAVIGFLVIGALYQFHIWNYPPEKQLSDTKVYLQDTIEFIKKPILWAADKPVIRAYSHYTTGLAMVFHRVSGGNTTYFLGEISNRGWKNYFPIVYLIKEPLAFHILTLLALLYAVWFIKKSFRNLKDFKDWVRNHFPEFAMLFFIGFYWLVSIKGDLNIGVRHLLPAFPFTILLVSAGTIYWLKKPFLKFKYIFLTALILWQVFSIISVYPHFLAYFNELAGGPDNGYKYVVDSNLDWGQDLKRLKNWVDEKGIDKIYIDYFGGGDPNYYLKTKYASWWGARNSEELPKKSYLAVSATLLMGGQGKAEKNFDQPTGFYNWLKNYKPIAKAGNSIFIYFID